MEPDGSSNVSPEAPALTERFTALRERLLGTALYVSGHREDALEAVQDAFLRCWRSRERAAAADDLDAWIFACVLNAARDLRRRRTVRVSRSAGSLDAEDAMEPMADQSAPPERAAAREDLSRVRAAIRTLPETEREVFLLRQNGDLPYERIAETLGIPVGTAKTRMRSALRRLREVIEERSQGGAAAGRTA